MPPYKIPTQVNPSRQNGCAHTTGRLEGRTLSGIGLVAETACKRPFLGVRELMSSAVLAPLEELGTLGALVQLLHSGAKVAWAGWAWSGMRRRL